MPLDPRKQTISNGATKPDGATNSSPSVSSPAIRILHVRPSDPARTAIAEYARRFAKALQTILPNDTVVPTGTAI